MTLVGTDVAPRHHEDRMTLLDDIAHEGVGGLQIEHVELVDRRRDYDERSLAHCVGERFVLDDLDQLVFEDHRARRDRKIAADLECLVVCHRDPALADVVYQVPDSSRKAFTARLHCEPQ